LTVIPTELHTIGRQMEVGTTIPSIC